MNRVRYLELLCATFTLTQKDLAHIESSQLPRYFHLDEQERDRDAVWDAPLRAVTTGYLGFANGWVTVPEVVLRCTHTQETRRYTTTRCIERRYCTVCTYSYDVDSSD